MPERDLGTSLGSSHKFYHLLTSASWGEITDRYSLIYLFHVFYEDDYRAKEKQSLRILTHRLSNDKRRRPPILRLRRMAD